MFYGQLQREEECAVKQTADHQHEERMQTAGQQQMVIKSVGQPAPGQSQSSRQQQRFFHRKRKGCHFKYAEQIQKNLYAVTGQEAVQISLNAKDGIMVRINRIRIPMPSRLW